MKKNKTRFIGNTIILVICFFFLIRFAISSYDSITPRLPDPKRPLQLYSNTNLAKTIVSAIKNAKESIFISVYSITDDNVIQALAYQCDNNIDITIVYDPTASKKIEKHLKKAKLIKRSPTKGLMHQKVIVIDKKQIWLGSANLTNESLNLHNNLVSGLYHPDIAETIIEYLKEPILNDTLPVNNYNIDDQQIELWIVPRDHDALNRIIKVIKQSKKSLKIAMFTWTNSSITEAVIEAFNRGVNVEIVIDRYSGLGASKKTAQRLENAGIRVRLSTGSELLHHKFLFVDNEILVNGSANWTYGAFNQNHEVFFIIKPLNDQQKNFMKSLWNVIMCNSKFFVK